MRTSLLTLGVALVALPAAARSQAAPQCRPAPRVREVERQLQGLVDSVQRANPDVAGIALTVLAPRLCLAFDATSGVADRTTGAPLTPAHPFRIASNTKTYTAAAVLRLAEEGKLGVDDPIVRHLPPGSLAPLRRDGYDVDAITVRHLLTHTAGIYDYAMDPRFAAIILSNPTHRWTRPEQVDTAMVWGAPYNAPGAAYHYTDTGYILLGEMVERLSGKGLAEALRSLLHYDALGLSSTWLETLEPRPAGAMDLAHQYMDGQDTRGFDASFDLYGGGGLAATTGDMARFTRALFTGGVYRKPDTIDLMTTLPTGITGARAYALGVYRQQLGEDVAWGHTGFWNTLSNHVVARDLTVAASITQQGKGTLGAALMRSVLQLVPRT